MSSGSPAGVAGFRKQQEGAKCFTSVSFHLTAIPSGRSYCNYYAHQETEARKCNLSKTQHGSRGLEPGLSHADRLPSIAAAVLMRLLAVLPRTTHNVRCSHASSLTLRTFLHDNIQSTDGLAGSHTARPRSSRTPGLAPEPLSFSCSAWGLPGLPWVFVKPCPHLTHPVAKLLRCCLV